VPVAFIMGGIFAPSAYEISRVVVDRRQQGRGFGKAAVALLLTEVRARDNVRLVKLGVRRANEAIVAFYNQFGFCAMDERWDDEHVLAHELQP
jgi:diamine N-acetyltransferase